MSLKSLVFAVAAAATLVPLSYASAAVCSGSVPASYSPLLSDVTINGVSADSCAYYTGNDNGWTPGAEWTSLGKSDAESPITGDVSLDPSGNISLSLLLSPADKPTGNLLLSWIGGPASMDFVFVLKASTEYFTYTFNDFLPASATGQQGGSYRVAIENTNDKTRDLSHMTFWARGERVGDVPGPNPVSTPGVFALLGIGALAAFCAAAQRRLTLLSLPYVA